MFHEAELGRRFAPDFAWGLATSAYQVEGAAGEDGRGPSIWDTFSHRPGTTVNGDTGDVACDHYHRYRDDVRLMAAMGVSAYRFSVSWSRVLPAGTGERNEPGLAFYERLVDELLAAGIRPMLTLFHWDLPQALHERGGFTNRDVVGWFGDYAALLGSRLGDRVTNWMTLNEPAVYAFLGHAEGMHAPGIRDWPTAMRVADNEIRAHAAAAEAIRAVAAGARIGIAVDVNHAVPARDSQDDRTAAEEWHAARDWWFLDPIFGRGYPALGRRAHESAGHLDGVELSDPPPGRVDFLGLNYYRRESVASRSGRPFDWTADPPPGAEVTQMGWHVAPDGLRAVLLRLHQQYAPPELVVSENGAAYPDAVDSDGAVRDRARQAYVARHIAALADARDAGVPVTGYYAWSFMDNFEWAQGYTKRFGLVHVDFATQRRTIKLSGEWYRELIAAHRAAAGPGSSSG